MSNMWPGINPEFISDEEEEYEDEYLKDDEICENILAGKQPAKRTKPNSVAVKQQLTMEAFANLAPRSKLAESRKIRTLDDDPRKQAPKSKEPPIGKKTTRNKCKSDNPPNPVQVRKMFNLFTQPRTTEPEKGVFVHNPAEPFIILQGELFCECCREPITEKKQQQSKIISPARNTAITKQFSNGR